MAAVQDERRKMIKALNDEARRDQLHKVKLAKELAKTQQVDGLDISKTLPLVVNADKSKATPVRAPLSGTPTNPEAGPSDTVLTKLTPGEAVIPKPVAQDPAYKPVIQHMVNEGRARNASEAPLGTGAAAMARDALMSLQSKLNAADPAMQGFSEGTESVQHEKAETKTKEKEEGFLDRIARALKSRNPKDVPLGDGYIGNAQKAVDPGDRKRQIDRAVNGYSDGTTNVRRGRSPLAVSPDVINRAHVQGFAWGDPDVQPLTDAEVMARESGGKVDAKNPYSSAEGLYQITTAAKKDAERFDPSLKGTNFKEPLVQERYREAYKGFLKQDLSTKGIDANEHDINRAWVAGPTGYQKIYTADPATPLKNLVSAEAYANNPNFWNKTAGEYLADRDPYSRKAAPNSTDPAPVDTSNYSNEGRGFAATPKKTEARPAMKVVNKVVGALSPSLYQEPDAPTPSVMYEGAEGSNAPAGEPPRPAATPTPTVMWQGESTPTPAPKANGPALPPLEKADEIPPFIVPTVDVTNSYIDQSPEAVKARMAEFDKMMESDAVANQIEAAKKETPKTDNPDQLKNWLADKFSKIFGETGLFNERELLKFSVLAAGGILTGASVGGSIRYAGIAAMNSAEHRYNAQELSKIEGQKWQRNQIEKAITRQETQTDRVEQRVYDHLPKATEAARAEATQYINAAKAERNPARAEALYSKALEILGNNPAPTGSATGKSMIDRNTGLTYEAVIQGDKVMIRDPNDYTKLVPPTGLRLTDASEYRSEKKEATDATSKVVRGRLTNWNTNYDGTPINKNIKDSDIQATADMIAEESAALKLDLGGNVNSNDFAKIVDNALQGIKEAGIPIKDITPETFRKYAYGEAMINTRKLTSDLYKTTDSNGKAVRPNPEAVAKFTSKVEEKQAQMTAFLRQKAKEEGRSDAEIRQINVSKNQAITEMEQQWKEMEKKDPQKYTDFNSRAKAGTRNKDGKPGWSPFLLWASEQ
jgi:hypothetical protein